MSFRHAKLTPSLVNRLLTLLLSCPPRQAILGVDLGHHLKVLVRLRHVGLETWYFDGTLFNMRFKVLILIRGRF